MPTLLLLVAALIAPPVTVVVDASPELTATLRPVDGQGPSVVLEVARNRASAKLDAKGRTFVDLSEVRPEAASLKSLESYAGYGAGRGKKARGLYLDWSGPRANELGAPQLRCEIQRLGTSPAAAGAVDLALHCTRPSGRTR